MTSHTSGNTAWTRAMTMVATGALAAGLSMGLCAPTALAAPATPTTDADAPPPMTADQVLAIIDADYDTGAGGGQISTLIHKIMRLRQSGFYPSNSNKQAIVDALDKRPNQGPLITALESTLAFQQRQASRQTGGGPVLNPPTIGIGGSGGGAPNPGSGGGINVPLA